MPSSSRGQGNFRGLEASRPRTKTSKSVLEAKDVLEDSTSGEYNEKVDFNLTTIRNHNQIHEVVSSLRLLIGGVSAQLCRYVGAKE